MALAVQRKLTFAIHRDDMAATGWGLPSQVGALVSAAARCRGLISLPSLLTPSKQFSEHPRFDLEKFVLVVSDNHDKELAVFVFRA